MTPDIQMKLDVLKSIQFGEYSMVAELEPDIPRRMR